MRLNKQILLTLHTVRVADLTATASVNCMLVALFASAGYTMRVGDITSNKEMSYTAIKCHVRERVRIESETVT